MTPLPICNSLGLEGAFFVYICSQSKLVWIPNSTFKIIKILPYLFTFFTSHIINLFITITMTHPNIVFTYHQRVEALSQETFTGVLPQVYGDWKLFVKLIWHCDVSRPIYIVSQPVNMALQSIRIKIQSIRLFSTVHMHYQAILTMLLDCVATGIYGIMSNL